MRRWLAFCAFASMSCGFCAFAQQKFANVALDSDGKTYLTGFVLSDDDLLQETKAEMPFSLLEKGFSLQDKSFFDEGIFLCYVRSDNSICRFCAIWPPCSEKEILFELEQKGEQIVKAASFDGKEVLTIETSREYQSPVFLVKRNRETGQVVDRFSLGIDRSCRPKLTATGWRNVVCVSPGECFLLVSTRDGSLLYASQGDFLFDPVSSKAFQVNGLDLRELSQKPDGRFVADIVRHFERGGFGASESKFCRCQELDSTHYILGFERIEYSPLMEFLFSTKKVFKHDFWLCKKEGNELKKLRKIDAKTGILTLRKN